MRYGLVLDPKVLKLEGSDLRIGHLIYVLVGWNPPKLPITIILMVKAFPIHGSLKFLFRDAAMKLFFKILCMFTMPDWDWWYLLIFFILPFSIIIACNQHFLSQISGEEGCNEHETRWGLATPGSTWMGLTAFVWYGSRQF